MKDTYYYTLFLLVVFAAGMIFVLIRLPGMLAKAGGDIFPFRPPAVSELGGR